MSKLADINEVQAHFTEWLPQLGVGEEIIVCQNQQPVARITPLATRKNTSVPGREKGGIEVLGDLNEPLIPLEDWNMLWDDFDPLK